MGQTLPPFGEWGYLPVGIWLCTLAELEVRFGFTLRRVELLDKLKRFVELAKQVGVLRMLAVGSFVTGKPEPVDIDLMVVLPETFDFNSSEGQSLRDAARRLEVHLFTFRQDERELIQEYMDFFMHDWYGIPKGIVQVHL